MSRVIFAILFSYTAGSSVGWAASVSKIKGDRVLINLEGTPAQAGQSFFALDSGGKRKGLVKILSVKDGQAVGQALKGKPQAGEKLVAAKAKSAKSSKPDGKFTSKEMSRFGLVVSYLINKMDAKFTLNSVEKTSNMTGNGFGALGYYDFKMSESTDIRASAGYEQFQVSESRTSNDCNKGTSTTCNAVISYLSAYGLYKYNFSNNPTRLWLGAGGGYLIALSKSSTVLESSEIAANYVMSVALGIEVGMSGGQYIPLVLEYSMFPSSSTVSANYIAFRAGWGWR